jgi:hypothetical protein
MDFALCGGLEGWYCSSLPFLRLFASAIVIDMTIIILNSNAISSVRHTPSAPFYPPTAANGSFLMVSVMRSAPSLRDDVVRIFQALILFLSIPICKMLVLILPRESHGCNIICA